MKSSRKVVLAILAIAACEAVFAHARSESYSNWDMGAAEITGVVTVSSGEVMALMDAAAPLPLDELFARHLLSTVTVRAAGRGCTAAAPLPLDAARGFVRVELGFDCDGARPAELRYRALFDVLPAHVHYARIFEDGRLLADRVVTDRADTWQRGGSARGDSFLAYLDLGLRHIASGIDHIAFLAGMLLVAGTIGRSIAAVTGFTLGHSVSLAAAVLGYLQANGRLVEAFIGFTVALVAVEYFLVRRPETRALPVAVMLVAWGTGTLAVVAGLVSPEALYAYLGFGAFAICYLLATARSDVRNSRSEPIVLFVVTTCFGLIHGFGFAGFLMETGIEGASLALPLLGFNLGVEAGQIALVAIAFVLARIVRNTGAWRFAAPGAAALCGIGVFWFVGRSLAA